MKVRYMVESGVKKWLIRQAQAQVKAQLQVQGGGGRVSQGQAGAAFAPAGNGGGSVWRFGKIPCVPPFD